MSTINRRTFLHLGAAALGSSAFLNVSSAFETPRRKFTMNLNVGQVGVRATPLEAVTLAKKYGYESITPMTGAMLKYSPNELATLIDRMKFNNLAWGAAGVSPFSDADDARFKNKFDKIAAAARLFQIAGVTRCFTWMMSSSSTLTYHENFQIHARRIRQVGKLLADHNIRIGLEYLGTAALVIKNKFPFLRSSKETKELIAQINLKNVGIALDSWHWFHAKETEQTILELSNNEIVTADICDAPAGIPPNQMPDSPRKLACTTGVIDVAAFLRPLVKIGYDGPLGAEPFDNSLRKMSTGDAMTTATNSMKKAFALIK